MRLLYLSHHAVLEQEELRLFTDLGIDCFSPGGPYADPDDVASFLKRPAVAGLQRHPDLIEASQHFPRTAMPQEFVDNFDTIIVMGGIGDVEVLVENWPRIKHKNVIWRTIGQSVPDIERPMLQLRKKGLKIVRYSPKEKNIPDYAGEDALIRFYKDEKDYIGWNGKNVQVINVSQSLLGRANNCFYNIVAESFSGFNAKVFGSGNDDLGNLNGGEISFDLLKGQLRDNRCYLYAGTWPASYTLSFIEAWMTGIPVITINKKLFNSRNKNIMDVDIFEVPELIQHGETGFVAENVKEIKNYINMLFSDGDFACKISEKARRKAVDLFGYEKIKKQWKDFLGV